MATRQVSTLSLAWAAVALTVVGMLAGVYLTLAGPQHRLGWHLFILSFGAWMAAAIAAMLVMWDEGYFDV